MKTRRFPPFGAIRAFEAAARHLNFTQAADEICVTPSAISHQIKTLEEYLDTAVFVRQGNRIELTPVGQAYLDTLTGVLDQLDAGTRRARGADPEAPLTIRSTSGFATRWLAPQIDRCPGHDQIQIATCEGRPSVDFARNGADVVIAWGWLPVPGVVMELLMDSGRSPVCSPHYKARAGLVQPVDLLGATLLHDEGFDTWGEWFRLADIPVPEFPRGPRFPHCELALRAAEEGQGVALAFDVMARRGLQSGKLVQPFDIATPRLPVYSVAYPESRARDPRIRALRDWIFDEVIGEGTLDRQSRILAAS